MGVSLRQAQLYKPAEDLLWEAGAHSSPYWILEKFIPNSLILRGQIGFHLASMDRDGQIINGEFC